MATWTSGALDKIGAATELEVAGTREDGSLRRPVTIWVVRDGDDLYVRSYKGNAGAWFRGTQIRHQGHIRAGGVDQDVTFADVTDPAVNDQVDAAYRAKYSSYGASYIDPMLAPAARSTTLRLVPR